MGPSIAQCRHLLTISERTFAGLDDSHRALEPQAGVKTAGWLIGHLAVIGDFGRRLCGRRPAICPKEWQALFNPGTEPSLRSGDYPSMKSLTEAFRSVYSDLCDNAATVEQSLLDAENPYAPARAPFLTAGLFVAYMMSGHLGYHLGQLVGWRAAAGLGRLRRADSLVA